MGEGRAGDLSLRSGGIGLEFLDKDVVNEMGWDGKRLCMERIERVYLSVYVYVFV
jgi:hypothetical protein